jgi:DNA-binding beta-propeller fold protein YncE
VPIVAVTQPVPVSQPGGFDYVAVDSARGKVYAAHPGGGGLLVADADTGNEIAIIPVGSMHGLAIDAETGHVFTGNGERASVSEVDPDSQQILRTAIVDGPVDAIAYDPVLGRIYADEDDGTRIFVVDTKTFKQIAVIKLPGHKPEYIQVDPETHDIYQNIATDNEIAVIDPHTLKVKRLIPTPQLKNNHPLQYDARDHVLIAAGENNVLAIYDRSGKLLHQVALPEHVDQCDWEPTHNWIACAGGGVTLFSFDGTSAPKLLDDSKVNTHAHTTAIDPKTGTIWLVYGDATSANIQGFTFK